MRANAQDFEARDYKLQEYSGWVKATANSIAFRMHDSVQADDLYQAGMIALSRILDTERFDDQHGLKFKTFAGIRVRGAMIDEIRDMDFLKRDERRRVNRVMNAISDIKKIKGADTNLSDASIKTGYTINKCAQLLWHNSFGGNYESIEDLAESGAIDYISELMDEQTPEHYLMQKENKNKLHAEIRDLPERQKLAIHHYLNESMHTYCLTTTGTLSLYQSLGVAKKTLRKKLKGCVNV